MSMTTMNQFERLNLAQALADKWFSTINEAEFDSKLGHITNHQIVEISSRITALLDQPAVSDKQVLDLGAAIADLFDGLPAALGISIGVLAAELPTLIPEELSTIYLARIAGLLGGITSGYVQQTHTQETFEQETLSEPDLDSLLTSRKNLMLLENRLQEINDQLQSAFEKNRQLETELSESKIQFEVLFEAFPVALCLIDASLLYRRIKKLLEVGVVDFELYFREHLGELSAFLSMIRIINVNQKAAELVSAENKESIMHNPAQFMPIGGDSLFINLVELISQGKVTQEGYFSGRNLKGEESVSFFHWAVNPSHEQNYDRILLALIETTAQKKAEEELRIAIERLQTVHTIETGILSAKSPKAIADIALKNLGNLVPSLTSAVSLFDSDHRFSTLLAGSQTKRVPGSRTPIDQSHLWDRLQQGKSVILNDLAAVVGKSAGLRTAVEIGGRSLMIVPLLVQEKIIGAINLISDKDNAFSKHEEEIVRQIGGSVAIAIHNSQLLETEKKARREAETLRRVAANINISLNQESLLDLILTQLAYVLPYDSASILQYDNGALVIAAQQGNEAIGWEVLDTIDPIPNNIIRLINEEQPLIIADTNDDPAWINFPGGEKIRCWLGVPMMAKESFIGLLMLDKWEPNFYADQEAKLTLAFANHAAIAIENARLYHETQQYGIRMEHQVAQRTRDLAALYEVTATTSQFWELETILEKVMAKVLTAMDCTAVLIMELDQSGTKLQLISHKGVRPAMIEYVRELPVNHPIIRQVFMTGEPILVSNMPNSPDLAGAPVHSTITHSATAPIRAKGIILGVIGIASERPQAFTREDIALLTSIADHIGIAIENDRLKKQSEHIVVTEERERLARDLHDSVTQSLFSLTLFAAAARELLHHEELSKAEQFLNDIVVTANRTHKEMRLLLYELRPSPLAKEGLIGALRQRLETVENRSGIQSKIFGTLTTSLSPTVEGALFQVANETLNNILKHSRATRVTINIGIQDSKVRMEIVDNGVGFDLGMPDYRVGMGLKNMKQRMDAIGGTLEYQSSPNDGTTIIASIDLIN